MSKSKARVSSDGFLYIYHEDADPASGKSVQSDLHMLRYDDALALIKSIKQQLPVLRRAELARAMSAMESLEREISTRTADLIRLRARRAELKRAMRGGHVKHP